MVHRNSVDLFRDQIREDINLLVDQWAYLDENLNKTEYAFNYWILSRIYNLDEEIISDFITEYNDKSIDCFVHYEESKELFIIQNKYISQDQYIHRRDIADFLYTPLEKLDDGEYKRSTILQNIFDKAKNDPEY